MSGKSTSTKPPAYYTEWGYIQGRSFTLNFLALGSMLVFYRIGSQLGVMTFGDGFGVLFFQFFFVSLAYYANDWVLKIALTSASTVNETESGQTIIFDEDGNEIKPVRRKRSVWKFAIAGLIATTGISIASNFFVADHLSGESPLIAYNQQLITAMHTDSTAKMKALTVIESAGKEERTRIEQAQAWCEAEIRKAVENTRSPRWRQDYEEAKYNMKAWFWVCKKCPSEYKAYRNGIKEALQRCEDRNAAASGYSQGILAALTPTLSGKVHEDSTLIKLEANTMLLEAKRADREKTLNIVLLVVTFVMAVLSIFLTIVLRDHRREHGQQIADNPTRFLMVWMDGWNRVRKVVSDWLYTWTFHQHEKAIRAGTVITYTVEHRNVVESLHATVEGDKRRCMQCHQDINHKRSDAKFCDDDCKNAYWAARRSKAG